MTDGDNIGLLGDTTALLARLVLCVRLAIAQPRSTECSAHCPQPTETRQPCSTYSFPYFFINVGFTAALSWSNLIKGSH